MRHGAGAASLPSSTEHTEYTCPMHPQIVRDARALVRSAAWRLSREPYRHPANPELTNMTRRLWVGAVLTLPLLAVMVSDVLPGRPLAISEGPAVGVDGISPGDAGGAVGRMAVL